MLHLSQQTQGFAHFCASASMTERFWLCLSCVAICAPWEINNWLWNASKEASISSASNYINSNYARCVDISLSSAWIGVVEKEMILSSWFTAVNISCDSQVVLHPKNIKFETSAAIVVASAKFSTHLSQMTVNQLASLSKYQFFQLALFMINLPRPDVQFNVVHVWHSSQNRRWHFEKWNYVSDRDHQTTWVHRMYNPDDSSSVIQSIGT